MTPQIRPISMKLKTGMPNENFTPGRARESGGRLLTYLIYYAFGGASLYVIAFMVGYGLAISPFIAIGVIVLVVADRRRVKLDAPVRFPRRPRRAA